ncbi:DinB family protein [Chloroflexota bacterium]
MKTLLLTSFGYNRWATARILKLAAELSDEQLDAGGDHSHGSLRGLLFHMYRTEWIWRSLSQSGSLAGPRPKQSHVATLQALQAAWEEEAGQMLSYLEGISQADLDEKLELTAPRGGTYSYTRWQMLHHLLLHSMGHRSETAAILTALDHSPGDLDLIYYLNEQNHPAEQ